MLFVRMNNSTRPLPNQEAEQRHHRPLARARVDGLLISRACCPSLGR